MKDGKRVCPACGSEQHKSECYMGNLGRLEWYRCRHCGMMFFQRSKKVRD